LFGAEADKAPKQGGLAANRPSGYAGESVGSPAACEASSSRLSYVTSEVRLGRMLRAVPRWTASRERAVTGLTVWARIRTVGAHVIPQGL
jgi:hypothetical protein